MQFGGNRKHREQRYPLRVHLYDKPPQEDIALEEFYKLAEKRLKGGSRTKWSLIHGCCIVLQAMETARLKQADKPFRDIIVKEVNEQFPDWSPVSLQYSIRIMYGCKIIEGGQAHSRGKQETGPV